MSALMSIRLRSNSAMRKRRAAVIVDLQNDRALRNPKRVYTITPSTREPRVLGV